MPTVSEPTLIVIRGNSGSGKSSVSKGVRDVYGRGLAIVGQDNVRRDVLRERDVPGGVNIGLIEVMTRYSLAHGYHVVLEGILAADRYGPMLQALRRDHEVAGFYLDVSIDETLRRHQTRPLKNEVSGEQMRGWYQHLDLLPGADETVIPEHSTLEATVRRVLLESGLADRMAAPTG